jgi:hypothetical protein
MKCIDMEAPPLLPFTFCCVTAVVAGLVPAIQAQETVQTIDRAPQNVFDTQQDEALAKFLNLGAISVRPHFNADLYYDSNLTLGNGNSSPKQQHELEDLVWRLAPGVLFGAGEFRGDKGTYASLDYTMRGSIYTKYSEFNSLDHFADFGAGWKLSKLTLGVTQGYQIENGKLIEAGGIVEQEVFNTTVTGKYELSEKTSFDLNGRQTISSAEEQVIGGQDFKLNNINEWVGEGWANYKPGDKANVGVGGAVGWRDIRGYTSDPTPNQMYEQGLVRGSYRVSEKVDVSGAAGIQFSQFQDVSPTESGVDKGPFFIFNFGGSYRPFERTSIALEAYRRDVASYTTNANYTLTGFRASVRQVFAEKYTASLSGGYENSDYTRTSDTSGNGDRVDDYFWIRPALDYQFNERLLLGVFYQYRTKNSNGPDNQFDYNDNQAGAYLTYRF